MGQKNSISKKIFAKILFEKSYFVVIFKNTNFFQHIEEIFWPANKYLNFFESVIKIEFNGQKPFSKNIAFFLHNMLVVNPRNKFQTSGKIDQVN